MPYKINFNPIFAALIVVLMIFTAAKCAAQFNPSDSIPIPWPQGPDGWPNTGDTANIWLYDIATGDTLTNPSVWTLYIEIPVTCPFARYDYSPLINLHNQGLNIIGVMVWEPHPDTLRPEWQSWISIYAGQTGGPHPWIMPQNVQDSVRYSQPLTFAERVAHAGAIRDRYGLPFRIAVDGTDNNFFLTLGDGMPNRGILVGPDNVICIALGWWDYFGFEPYISDCMGTLTAVTPPKLIVTKKREILLHKGQGYKIVKMY